jgi:hypothetical protein
LNDKLNTKILPLASLILSTFASLKPLILLRLRFVVAWTAYIESLVLVRGRKYIYDADTGRLELEDVSGANPLGQF